MTITSTHVDVRDLVVRYRRRTALNGLDLRLGAGVHGLLGPNGAGKTTLMRVLATVVRPASGGVTVLDGDVTGDARLRQVRRRLGYLPQQFGYYPRFTVREFVEYFAWLKEVPRDRIPAAVDRAIERAGLLDRADERLKRLSGGMLRRAGIAQAIVNDPDVLLLDEPTAGLDPEQRVDFRELLRVLGVDACVLVSTHLVEDVAAACADVTLLHEGRAVFRGTPAELAARGAGGDGDSPIERGYTAVLRAARSA
ncbi:ABC transporter ATP-binding protein [Jiangella endophytica]|uniref:ABC transporter ATP-binding protein n=1 Tax=Jiangella endophytica TaxID=1623398 RepID=UPI000E3484B2|nr:ABC transporter ATP-binding protein [Jiangella endophytica]